MRVVQSGLKWLGVSALVVLAGIALFFGFHILSILIVGGQYQKYYSDKSDVSIIAQEFNLGLTNKYHLAGWSYNTFGLADITFSTKEKRHFKAVWVYKTKEVIPIDTINIPILQKTVDIKLRNNLSDFSTMYENSTEVQLNEFYNFTCLIKYDKNIRIKSAYMHGEIFKDEKVETGRYRYRLIYANQRKLAFCEDAKNLRQGALYFYFERRGFINTDIAIVQMKNEPGNLYFVYAFDEWAGKNHETIKGFMKDYFDIAVK